MRGPGDDRQTAFSLCWPEVLREFLRPAFLMPHAQEVQRRIHPVEIGKRHFPRGVALQIVPEDRPGRLPAEAHFVQLLRSHIGEVEARSNGIFGETSIVLQPADALFRHRKQKFAVARDARRRIMHLRIINPQCQHSSSIASRISPYPATACPALNLVKIIVTRANARVESRLRCTRTLPEQADPGHFNSNPCCAKIALD